MSMKSFHNLNIDSNDWNSKDTNSDFQELGS